MTAETFEIQVQDDHLERIAQTRRPVLALAELMWNAVEGDARHIDVTLVEDDLEVLKAIRASDNRHGIPFAEAGELFSRLGDLRRACPRLPSRRCCRMKTTNSGVRKGPGMKLHYYPETDSPDAEFKTGPGAKTREVSDSLNVDLDSASDVVGYDIDRTSPRLTLETGPLTGKDE